MSLVILTVCNIVKETPWDIFDIFSKERNAANEGRTIKLEPHYLEELCFTYKTAQKIKLEIKKSQKQ